MSNQCIYTILPHMQVHIRTLAMVYGTFLHSPPHADIESECMPNVESKQVEYLGQLRQNGLVSGNCDLMLYYIIMTQYVMCECFYV